MTLAAQLSALQRTPLHDIHVALGAQMAPFGGYEMPIRYPSGIMKEHLHTRAAASLFDVSHMGQIVLRPNSGRLVDVALALERLVPIDVLGLAAGRQRYAFFTNANAGIVDDLMIAHRDDHFLLVVNASQKTIDEAYLRAAMARVCTVEVWEGRALLALQGTYSAGPSRSGQRHDALHGCPLTCDRGKHMSCKSIRLHGRGWL
jgi:aminomethyltransferase